MSDVYVAAARTRAREMAEKRSPFGSTDWQLEVCCLPTTFDRGPKPPSRTGAAGSRFVSEHPIATTGVSIAIKIDRRRYNRRASDAEREETAGPGDAALARRSNSVPSTSDSFESRVRAWFTDMVKGQSERTSPPTGVESGWATRYYLMRAVSQHADTRRDQVRSAEAPVGGTTTANAQISSKWRQSVSAIRGNSDP